MRGRLWRRPVHMYCVLLEGWLQCTVFIWRDLVQADIGALSPLGRGARRVRAPPCWGGLLAGRGCRIAPPGPAHGLERRMDPGRLWCVCGLRVYRCRGVPAYWCTGIRAYRCTNILVYWCTGVPVSCTSILLYQCTLVSVYRCTGIPMYRCTDVLAYQCFAVLVTVYW